MCGLYTLSEKYKLKKISLKNIINNNEYFSPKVENCYEFTNFNENYIKHQLTTKKN